MQRSGCPGAAAPASGLASPSRALTSISLPAQVPPAALQRGAPLQLSAPADRHAPARRRRRTVPHCPPCNQAQRKPPASSRARRLPPARQGDQAVRSCILDPSQSRTSGSRWVITAGGGFRAGRRPWCGGAHAVPLHSAHLPPALAVRCTPRCALHVHSWSSGATMPQQPLTCDPCSLGNAPAQWASLLNTAASLSATPLLVMYADASPLVRVLWGRGLL